MGRVACPHKPGDLKPTWSKVDSFYLEVVLTCMPCLRAGGGGERALQEETEETSQLTKACARQICGLAFESPEPT